VFAETFDAAGAPVAALLPVEAELVEGAEGAAPLDVVVVPPQPARPMARRPAAHAVARRAVPRIMGISCSGGVASEATKESPTNTVATLRNCRCYATRLDPAEMDRR
jgi:hypothetical protein